MNARRHLALRLVPLLAFAALGAGCVGYNHALFVTKSNAGLDFDTKPPTTEVTISRKETVIAPSFEGGATPPVMASFQPHVGTNAGLKNFFLGVDQTFAGGDAAIAMAGLYNRADAPAYSETDYDSSILVREPSAKLFWNKIPDAGTARPFVFATDTMVGLKIGWTGVGQIPDSVKAGFNRKEVAWAPLSKTEVSATVITPAVVTTNLPGGGASTTTTPAPSKTYNTVRLKIPSFLATVDSDAESDGADGKASSIQYFATGKAATLLALQPAVRKALFIRMDPSLKASFNPAILGETLVMINSIIDGLATENDLDALRFQAALSNLDGITQGGAFGKRYQFSNDTLTETDSPLGPTTGSLGDFTSLNRHLTVALSQLDACIQAMGKGTSITFVPPDLDKRVGSVRTALERRQQALRTELEQNPTVQNAYFFVRMKLSSTQ